MAGMNVKRTEAAKVSCVFASRTFENDGFTLPYRIYIPKNYDCGERYPLLVFLHGAGERGTDNEKQLIHIQHLFNDPSSPVYDSIVLAPQCPEDSQWVLWPWEKGNYSIEDTPESPGLETLCLLIDDVRDFYNVDDDRLYVTGLSMGGFGTWDLLSRHGARFAAGLPICGGGDPSYAELLKRIPIRTFHGSEDTAVPVAATRQMYAAIRKAGGELIDYTEFDGAGHGVWGQVYEDRDNIDWLYSQSLAERRKKAEKKAKLVKIAAAGAGGALSALLVILGITKNKKKNKPNVK
ncbi:MAG: phospholipase [Ruminococcaceae bacterium]|jgi:predicted peptidase|nr:phospholipase [Oscillospiraceae bacterium]